MNTTPITQEAFDAAFDKVIATAHQDDCQRITSVAWWRLGIEMTSAQAEHIWSDYSDGVSASWLIINHGEEGDDKIVDAIRRFVQDRT